MEFLSSTGDAKHDLISVVVLRQAWQNGHHITVRMIHWSTSPKLANPCHQIMNLLFLGLQLCPICQILCLASSTLSKIFTWCRHCIIVHRQCLQLVCLHNNKNGTPCFHYSSQKAATLDICKDVRNYQRVGFRLLQFCMHQQHQRGCTILHAILLCSHAGSLG